MAEYLSPAVYIEEIPSGNKPIQAAGTSTGAFVGVAEKGPIAVAVPIQNFAEFDRTFGTYTNDGYLAFAVKAFFEEGGTSCFVVRTAHYFAGVLQAKATKRTFVTVGNSAEGSITLAANSPGTWGDDFGVEITHPDADTFRIAVRYKGADVESFDALSMDPANESYVATLINDQSGWLTVIDESTESAQTVQNRRPLVTTGFELLTVGGGTAGNSGLSGLDATDFEGDSDAGTGLHAFDKVQNIRIVCMPDAPPDAHGFGMSYCAKRRDCFFVADAPLGAQAADVVLHYKTAQGTYAGTNALNSKYGALYTPWIYVFDPRSGGKIAIPPCGAVAGRYAATDATRGVHKAPAGTVDGRLLSVLGLAVEFTATDQEKLNPKGINVIRRFTGVGNVVWGARTVTSDPEWRYLSVRRLFLFLETSILQSTSWIVFEPNDESLWKSIIRNVSAFLKTQWLAGALVGGTPEEAFYVKCDAETNPQESIDLGRVITEIGVAPSKPAEFVIFRLSQFAGGAQVSE